MSFASEVKEELMASIEPDTSKTGTLVVYSPNSEGEQNAIIPAFKAKYPNVDIKVEMIKNADALIFLPGGIGTYLDASLEEYERALQEASYVDDEIIDDKK